MRNKTLSIAVLIAGALGTTSLEARVCRNSHGKRFHCHHVVAPRINTHDRHPVKIQRCRGHVGKFNDCK